MITLEITACPNQELIGEYNLHYPFVRIGKSSSCHIYLDTSTIKQETLCLRIEEGGVLIWEESGAFYQSNGKKYLVRKITKLAINLVLMTLFLPSSFLNPKNQAQILIVAMTN
jgi:hypothetical protein